MASAKYEIVKKYYNKELWSEGRVRMAVEKGWITSDEYDEIVKKQEEE